jgi:hypothetical protein
MPASFNRVAVSSVKFRTLKTVSEFVSVLSAFIVRLWGSSAYSAVGHLRVSEQSGLEGSLFCYWSEGNYVCVRA